MSSRNLNILIVEDSHDDYLLIVRLLKKEFSSVNVKKVESKEEFLDQLDNNWDAILSDNSLPSFSATEALKTVREIDETIPFLIVSGTIRESVAVNTMKAGASDYIQTPDYNRLIPVLNKELREYKDKKVLRNIESQLKESQYFFELLANNIRDLVAVHKPDSTYIWVSPSSEYIMGFEPEDLIGKKHLDFIHEEDIKDSFLKPFGKDKTNHPVRFNYRLKRVDGQYIYAETILQPTYENNELKQIISSTRDITEQEQASILLSESELRYHSVVDSIAEGIILISGNGKIIDHNNRAEHICRSQLTIQSIIETLNKTCKILTHNFKPFKNQNYPHEVTFQTKEPCTNVIIGFENKITKEIKWYSCSSAPYEEPNAKFGVVISFNDITEQRKNEEKIRIAASELKMLIDTANAPIFGLDWQGKVNEWNQVTACLTGYSKDEVLGKTLINELILKGYKPGIQGLMKKVLDGYTVSNYELPINTKSGKAVTILFNATARRSLEGEIIGILCIGQDITELIEYRNKLEQKVEERTEELNKALENQKELVAIKSKFVSMASHEFRTPLATINFASDFLSKYNKKLSAAEVEKKTARIREQVNLMTELLNDILDIGKKEAGKINFNPSSIRLNLFIKQLVEEVEHTYNKSHEVLVSYSSDKKEISADRKLLRNILINLLSNAIKFSPNKDKVLLEIIVKSGILTMKVRDWGMGIEKKDHKKIFEAFHRTKHVGTIQGTGLGLTIVKKAVELHGGSLSVCSEIGKGTTFKIEITL